MYFFRLCVIFVAILVAQNVWAQRRAASVDVQPVEQQIFAETVPVFAQVVTARDGEVAGRISGSVNRVYVLAGDRVQMGDPIIELNTELLLIRLNQSQAQIVEAQAGTRTAAARLASAQISFDRISRLANTSSFSQVRFEELKAKTVGSQIPTGRGRRGVKKLQRRVLPRLRINWIAALSQPRFRVSL